LNYNNYAGIENFNKERDDHIVKTQKSILKEKINLSKEEINLSKEEIICNYQAV
jgi:hypothetical protein